jgi:predicted amidohydrolase
MSILRVALLHLAPRLGDLAYNCALVETAITTATTCGADWAVTPELCLCGYEFSSCIGVVAREHQSPGAITAHFRAHIRVLTHF